MKNFLFLVLFIFVGTYYNNVSNDIKPYTAEPMFSATSHQGVASVFSYDLYLDENSKARLVKSEEANRGSKRAILDYKNYVRSKHSHENYECYDKLIFKESSWNPDAKNPKSTAYGLGQFLDKTWHLVPQEKTSDPYQQLDAMFHYVENRYGNACNAWSFWLKKNWY
jgi:hypothetical protein